MRAKRIDANQTGVFEELRAQGVHIENTSRSADGFPDSVMWYKGGTYLPEIKNPDKHWKLTPAQVKFHGRWPGKNLFIITKSQDFFDYVAANAPCDKCGRG